MVLFRRQRLRPGLIFSVNGNKPFSKLVSSVLSSAFNNLPDRVNDIVPTCPCHDAMIIKLAGKFYVGESRPLKARLTPLAQYEEEFEGDISVNPRLFAVKVATEIEERKAAEYWLKYVNDTYYDFMAFPKLYLKQRLMYNFHKAAGWEWAHWCTEGVAKAYQDALGFDVYLKTNPTPLTTIKRVLEGVFVDVSQDMFIP
ncbi:hypothetical protein ACFLQL_01540 [Verrucomicrobiota bacterium]